MMIAAEVPTKLGAPEALEHKPVRIVDSIVSAVFSARREVKDVTFAPRFEQVPTGTTLASPDRLNWAITDMLVTAARHSPSGGQVKVHISQGSGHVAIDIAAQGKTLTPKDLGTFVDVAVRRALHQGTACVRNGSTEGFVIEVRLPLAPA